MVESVGARFGQQTGCASILSSLCMSNRLAQWRNLSTFMLSSSQQLKAHQASSITVHLPA